MPVTKPPAKSAKVLNIAHRGARAYAPENTLAAFVKAVQMGCDMFELDVRLSSDGELVVFHDEDLLRCTDVASKFPKRDSYMLADFSYAELSVLDAGSWYTDELALKPSERQAFLQTLTLAELSQFVTADDLKFYRSGQVTVPSLKQALELAKANRLSVNVELKGLADAKLAISMTEQTLLLIERLAMTKQVVISSFERNLLEHVRTLTTDIIIGLLTGDKLADPVQYLQNLAAEAYHPDANLFVDDDLQMFTALRQQGMLINVWTCNQPEQIQKMISLGATGIISDYPNRVAQDLRTSQK